MVAAVAAETLRLYARNLARLVALAVPFAALGFAASSAVDRIEDQVVYTVVSTLAVVVTYGLIAAAVAEWYRRRREPEQGTSIYGRVGRLAPPIAAMTVLSSIGIVVGIVALIVPGLILVARWSVAIPVLLNERTTPTRALGRSWSLVRGHSGAALVIALVPAAVAAAATEVALRAAGGRTTGLATSWAVDAAFQPLVGLAAAVLHARLPREEWTYEADAPPPPPLGQDRPPF